MPQLRLVIAAIIAIFCLNSKARSDNYPAGARFSGMANASVAIFDIWSGYHNQAGLANIERITAGVFYDNRYNLKEVGIKAATILLPVSGGNFNLNYTQFGFKLYQESKFGLAYARALGKHLWAGIQLDYFRLRLAHTYGKGDTYTFETGILVEPFKDLFLGFHLFNPIQASINTLDSQEELPVRARLGLAWILSKQLILSLDTEKDMEHNLNTKIGMEYQVANNIYMRAGVASIPKTISMGLGLIFKHIKTDIAFSHHSVLGYSPSISLNFNL